MTKSSRIPLFFIICIMGVLVLGGFFLFGDHTPPEITLSHNSAGISPNLPVIVTVTDEGSAIKQVSVAVRFQENVVIVREKEFDNKSGQQELTFSLAEAGLKHNDTFDLEITALDTSFGSFGFGNKQRVVLPMRLDAAQPRMTVKSPVPYARRGGSVCVVFGIDKEVTQTGVFVNDLFFPAFRQETGDFLCFFAFPYFMEVKDFKPKIVALDEAGNQRVQDLPVTAINRQFKSDSINISQNFLDAKAAEFENMAPGAMTDLERFLIINGEIRRQNAQSLMELGKQTAGTMLWKGSFMRHPRASSRAGFADHRTYLWEGQKVDEQTHLGFDLASTKQSPVYAANDGIVVFAGYLGIYGYLVVIDHGVGLQSLYSHLSSISVENGANVAKGDSIGQTGSTGMAGGDHLHFGILISGLEVTPLEWLDSHWINDNVINRIKEAGGLAPEFTVEPTPAEQTQQKAPAGKQPRARKPGRN